MCITNPQARRLFVLEQAIQDIDSIIMTCLPHMGYKNKKFFAPLTTNQKLTALIKDILLFKDIRKIDTVPF